MVKGKKTSTTIKKRPRGRPMNPPTKQEVADINYGETQGSLTAKRKLIKQLFDENQDLELEEIITNELLKSSKGGKDMGKTVSSLKGVRETLEDIMNIEQLTDLIKEFRTDKQKRTQMKNKVKEDEPQGNGMGDMMSLFPLLQKMQNGGVDTGKIDPMMFYMMMANNKSSGNNNLGNIFFMLSMANLFNQPTTQTNGQQKGQVQQPNLTSDVLKTIYTELKNVMNQQSQQPPIDPIMLLLLKQMNQGNKGGDKDMNLILDKMNQMINNNQQNQLATVMQQSNQRFERIAEMFAGALNRDPPEEKIRNNFSLFRELQGDQRVKTKDEMDHNLEIRKLDIEDVKRQDLMSREERQQMREDTRSQSILSTTANVVEKVIGDGVGNLIGQIMNAKSGLTSKKKPQVEFSPEDLDNF